MTFYDEMADVAREVIGEFKQGVLKLKRHTPGTGPSHNPGPGTWNVVADLQGTVGGVGKEYIDGTVIVATDLMATISVPSVHPAMGDRLEIDGAEIPILAVKRIPEAGPPVAFKLIVRK